MLLLFLKLAIESPGLAYGSWHSVAAIALQAADANLTSFSLCEMILDVMVEEWISSSVPFKVIFI